MSQPIPLVNLDRQYSQLKPELLEAFEEVCESQAFIQGKFARKFEEQFAAAIGARHGIGCGSGTAALSVALEALGIGQGDEVITVAHTFFATAEAICNVGGTPVFVDVDSETYTMDTAAAESAVTSRTKAILPVHIYGTLCNMERICAIARLHGLVVIEDAAQAHMARYGEAFAGTIGDAGAFSFYPGKNLGAYGDAGFVTVQEESTAARVRGLCDHGRRSKYEHDIIGYNQRMDGLQAAILSAKLPYLAEWTRRRQEVAMRYRERLNPAGFQLQKSPADSESVYHLFVVQVSNRDETLDHMASQGISCGIHYPVPLHLQPALAGRAPGRGALPVTEQLAERIFSLPICGDINDDEVDRVCDAFLTVGTA